MVFFYKYVIGLLLFSFIAVSVSALSPKVKFFDAKATIVSYSGLRLLRGKISDINPYLYRGNDYYIAYYSRSSGRLLSYKYMSNGNVSFEDRLVYSRDRLVKFSTYIDKVLVHTTYLYKDSFKTKRVAALDSSYIISYFDKAMRLFRAEKYDSSDKLITYTKFSYDVDGRLFELSYFSSISKPIRYIRYNYSDGTRSKKLIYDASMELIGYTLYFYNDSSLLVEARRFNPSGKLLGYITYEYSDVGILRYKQYYDPVGRLIPR